MPLYGPSNATATVAANTNSVAITGMDLNAVVQQGMTISFGARDRAVGDAWIINTVVPNGTNGGTLTTAGSIPTAYNSVPFLIDTRGFNGTDSSFAAAVSLKLLATLTNLLGTATNLFAGSRQLVLDKVASTAIGRIAFAIAGRTWGDIAQRSLSYTPTGGQTVSAETLALRAFPDGSTPTDAIVIDLSTGGVDFLAGSVTMTAGSMVDLASAPKQRVTIAGTGSITSFGPGKQRERLVTFRDSGAVLKHSASLALPSGTDITASAGDTCQAVSDEAGNWRVIDYQPGKMTPYTPSVTASGGTISALGAVSARYQMLNKKLCFVMADVTVSSAGTAAGNGLFISLPFASANAFMQGIGREVALSGSALTVTVQPGSSNATVFSYKNDSIIANGARIAMSLLYEVA